MLESVPLIFAARDGRPVAIRHAAPEDAAGSVAVVKAVAEEGLYLLVEPEHVRTPEQQHELLQRLHPTDDLFLVAEVDGLIVGQIDAYRGRWDKLRHTAELGVVILDGYRNLGIGRRFMQAAEDWARDLGLLRLGLAVFSSNERAIHLYRACGYEVEGIRSRHLYIDGKYVDELIMARSL